MICPLTVKQPGILECPDCGQIVFEAGDPSSVRIRCRLSPQAPIAKPPGLLRRVSNFLRALARHARDRFAKCSRREIERRWAICRGCPLFDAARNICTHASCGCRVGDEERFRNKLAWKSEGCPDGKWGPAVNAPSSPDS